MNTEDQQPEPEEVPNRPAPRNPFAEQPGSENPDSIIKGKRTAALSGMLIGLALAILVGAICILGAIAFAD